MFQRLRAALSRARASLRFWDRDGREIGIEGSRASLLTSSDQGRQDLETVPAAFAAINILTEALARCPVEVGRLDDSGVFTPLPEHALNFLFRWPSRRFDRFQAWSLVYRPMVASGNGYMLIRRNRHGLPVELAPATAAPYIRDGGLAYYNVQELPVNYGMPLRMRRAPRQVLCLHGAAFDGILSPSPVATAGAATLATIRLAARHNREQLDSGMNSRRVLKMDVQLAHGDWSNIDDLQKSVQENYAGAMNSGKTPILPPGYDLSAVAGMSAVDLQLIELLKWSVEDVCRVFSVPPRMVYHYHEGQRSRLSLEMQSEDFERWSLRPHTARIEAQFNAKLLTVEERMSGLVCRFSTTGLRSGSLSESASTADLLVSRAGVATVNEGRAMVGLPPRPEGDELRMPKGGPTETPGGASGPPSESENDV